MSRKRRRRKPAPAPPSVASPLLEADQRNQSADLKLVRQAIHNRWPIKPEMRQLVLNQLLLIVAGRRMDGTEKAEDDIDDRTRVNATRVFVAADAINQKIEEAEKERPAVNVNVNVPIAITTVEIVPPQGEAREISVRNDS